MNDVPEIDPHGDPTVNAGIALGRLIHECLLEIHQRLDRIEAKIDGHQQSGHLPQEAVK